MSGRVAVVTGGVGGIGTEICRGLHNAGFKVVSTYAPFEKDAASAWKAEREAEGTPMETAEVDVSNFESCQTCIAAIEQQVGPVEVLVNNAGITKDSFLHKMTYEQWSAVLRVNLDSAFNMTRQVINGMRERGFGRIVNISSINGRKGQFGQANYSAAKAGMHGFTMAVAQEGAAKNVTCNTISPGYIATKMVMAMKEEVVAKIVSGVPVGRLGKPEEIARVVVFLAEDSGYITGANIDINGGQFMG
ncbi:MAG: acetoacetyl-CoA reductase [Magnetococcales bacterium]|nr:acetoacetyl-CoA reductase [Magnetococcales bacterium]